MSLKQRLVDSLTIERDALAVARECEEELSERVVMEGKLRSLDWSLDELRRRGSGPLPYHLRDLAKRRGIV